MPEALPVSITEQIIAVAPEKCQDCDYLFARGVNLARKVVDGKLTLTNAQRVILGDIVYHCRGRRIEHRGWGMSQYVCTYSTELCESGSVNKRRTAAVPPESSP